jgi:predicted TIM-barrel fold metal-dependent hydrolase
LPAQSSRPYGNPIYRPIFEAAAGHDLVVGLHYGGWPGQAPTSVGWPSHYIEQWVARSQHAQTQVMSIVSEGVFSSVPGARVAVLECGWAWLPAFLWRFDKDWKGLRRETPWVQRLPSDYVREHVRFSLQPVDGPRRPEHLARVLDQIDGAQTLMFSTDYPHLTFEDDADAIPAQLLAGEPDAVLADTASAFYRLDQKGRS